MSRRRMILLAIFLVIGLALLAYGIYLWRYRYVPEFNQATVTVGGHVFHVALADTMAKRAEGLSGRAKLQSDEGMLFIFPVAFRYPFWMKDMLFPLDMIWVRNSQVVDITANAPVPAPGQNIWTLPAYTPAAVVDQVLEVDAGTAAADGIQIGDAVQVKLPQGESPQ